MTSHPFYLAYGMMLLGLAGMAGYRGWTVMPLNQGNHLPRTVRDNPGAYRSTYGGYSRYSGGK